MAKRKSLLDTYRFPGLCPRAPSKRIWEDPKARISRRACRHKKRRAAGVGGTPHRSCYERKVRRLRDLSGGERRIDREVEIHRVRCRRGGNVKQAKFPGLTTNPFYTKRFAWYGGQRCREPAVKDGARELKLDWKTVKSLEKEEMREPLRRTGMPGPQH